MLGIILIIYIAQKFYKLAKEFIIKNPWIYAILAIITYYAGAILVGGVTIGLIIEFLSNASVDDFSDTMYSLMAFPFGIASVVLLYYLLKKNWKKSYVEVRDEIQDIGKRSEDFVE